MTFGAKKVSSAEKFTNPGAPCARLTPRRIPRPVRGRSRDTAKVFVQRRGTISCIRDAARSARSLECTLQADKQRRGLLLGSVVDTTARRRAGGISVKLLCSVTFGPRPRSRSPLRVFLRCTCRSTSTRPSYKIVQPAAEPGLDPKKVVAEGNAGAGPISRKL